MLTMKTNWKHLVTIPSSEPDAERRRRLLNITLATMELMMIILLITILILYIVGAIPKGDLQLIGVILAAMGFLGLLYLIERIISSRLASILFVIFLTILLAFSDSPAEVAYGRSAMFFVIPIIAASMLIRPAASYLVTFIVIILQSILSIQLVTIPNILYFGGFLIVATISWLMSRTLENAIVDLRATNRELDQRVTDRTRELSATLVRERIEAGKNQAILESIADSVLVFDLEGQLISANPAFCRMVDREVSDLVGQSILDLLGRAPLTDSEKESVEEAFQSAADYHPVQIQMDQRALSLLVAPVTLESGEVTGTVAVLHDVSREVEISNMKTTFVSMVSHELRTPLSAAMGLLELLHINTQGKLAADENYLIDRVMANNQILLKLVNDLLDMTRIEAGTLSIQMEPFSPAKLMMELSETMASPISAKGLEWVTQIDEDVPEVLISDSARLRQILVNLATNALKFTDRGTVRVRFFLPDRTNFGIEVSDTGQGIPEDAQEHIFDPFWQVDSSISRHHGGAGLGLFIVMKLVQLLGGKIKVESSIDQGSMFTVTLPLQVGSGADLAG